MPKEGEEEESREILLAGHDSPCCLIWLLATGVSIQKTVCFTKIAFNLTSGARCHHIATCLAAELQSEKRMGP